MKRKVAKRKESKVVLKPDKDKTASVKKAHDSRIAHKLKQLDLTTTLVKMWEEFRKQKCPNRAEILQNILTIIRGRVREVSGKIMCLVLPMFCHVKTFAST